MHSPLPPDTFDVAIIGAGVVGCAMARRFTLEGARVVVVEKATDILDGASKGNSAILHTGFDAPTGSLEISLIRDGYREYSQIHHEMGLPLEKTGAYVVAWSDDERARLEGVVARAHANGVTDVRMADACELARNEPELARHAMAAVAVPGESIIDPWSAPYAYLTQALENGAMIYLDCEIIGGDFIDGEWTLKTSRGTLKSRHVINCAGLFGDTLDQALLGAAKFEIRPRKGQIVVFDKTAAKLVNAIILPVPTSQTKGVVVTRTVFGNVLVGPTAQDQVSRTDTSTDEATLRALMDLASIRIPALAGMPVTAAYAGLRPATGRKDYRIEAMPEQNWITVGGIRSTGLSAALGIATHIYRLYGDMGARHHPIDQPVMPKPPVLTCRGARDWALSGHGKMVCHCELVTEREVQNALTGPLAARSLAGLKRQTRVTMGHCQGFYCSAAIAELADDHFDTPLSVGAVHD